ncbi:MAG: M3 family metallopeptidase, partial [Saprospiraceae bacterium]
MFKTLSLLSVFTIFGFFFNDIYMNQNNLIPTTFVSSENVSEDQNPLLQPWSGNYGGYPAFDKVKIKDFLPAFEVAMKEGLNEIEKIANNPAPPTFENTMLELEKSGHSISRLIAIYGVWSSTMNSDEFQNVETIIEPKLSEYSDKIAQNSKLFKRIEKIYNSEEYKTLSLEAQRLTYLKYSGLVRNGARLNETDKAKLSNYNQALAALYTKFSQNLLSDENDKIVVIENKTDLKGLSKDLVDAAASAGVGVNKGKWVINNTRSSVDPFLTYAENRDLREKVWRMFISRGDNGDKNDNNSTIVEILKIRALRAKLLGFKTHADWRLDNSMAKTPENAMKLMMDVWEPAILKVKEEVADMQAIADKEGKNIKIEPWDYRYYAEKVRLAKYDLDQNQVKEYLQLDKLKEGMFWV